MVNINERRLVAWRRGFITENIELVGLEYLWKAVLVAPDSIVYKPIELLKDVFTSLSAKLQQDQVCMYWCIWGVHTCALPAEGMVEPAANSQGFFGVGWGEGTFTEF